MNENIKRNLKYTQHDFETGLIFTRENFHHQVWKFVQICSRTGMVIIQRIENKEWT